MSDFTREELEAIVSDTPSTPEVDFSVQQKLGKGHHGTWVRMLAAFALRLMDANEGLAAALTRNADMVDALNIAHAAAVEALRELWRQCEGQHDTHGNWQEYLSSMDAARAILAAHDKGEK